MQGRAVKAEKSIIMKKLVLFSIPAVFLLSSFGPSASVKNFNYDVLIDGKPIGSHAISKTELNGTTNFRVENETAAGLIRRSEHKFVMLTSFDESKFVSSDMKTFVDQKLESSSVIHWDGHHYVKQDGEQLTEIQSGLVTFSSPCMFFEEPMNRTTLFYEKYGLELPVTDLGNHTYEVKLPNGAKECYTYKDGEVVRVDLIQTFTTLSLVAKS